MTPWLQHQLLRFDSWAADIGNLAWRLREKPLLVDITLQHLARLHESLSGNAHIFTNDLMLP